MPHLTVKDLEKMITDRLDNRGKKPEQSIIGRLRQSSQLKIPQLPKLPKI